MNTSRWFALNKSNRHMIASTTMIDGTSSSSSWREVFLKSMLEGLSTFSNISQNFDWISSVKNASNYNILNKYNINNIK